MLSAIVNAGGGSTRMGTHKALLPVPPSGAPLLARTVATVAAVVEGPVIVIANHAPVQAAARALPNVTVTGDVTPDQGPLAGLAAGLALVPDWALALACDMPLLQVELLRLLADRCGHGSPTRGVQWDAVIPIVDGRPQSMAAAYHPRCLPFIQAMLAQGRLRIRDLFSQVRVLYLEEAELRAADPALRSFVNANTPQEWEAVVAALQHGPRDHE